MQQVTGSSPVSSTTHNPGPLAQLVEQRVDNAKVAGSSPAGTTTNTEFWPISSEVEHSLDKRGVDGSIPSSATKQAAKSFIGV